MYPKEIIEKITSEHLEKYLNKNSWEPCVTPQDNIKVWSKETHVLAVVVMINNEFDTVRATNIIAEADSISKDALIELLTQGKISNYKLPRCPYCGEENDPDEDFDINHYGTGNDWVCERCGKTFNVTFKNVIEWTSERIAK